jgi:hypothetical protein
MRHINLLEKQEQAKLKSSRQKEITKIWVGISKMVTKRTIQRINETKLASLKR